MSGWARLGRARVAPPSAAPHTSIHQNSRYHVYTVLYVHTNSLQRHQGGQNALRRGSRAADGAGPRRRPGREGAGWVGGVCPRPDAAHRRPGWLAGASFSHSRSVRGVPACGVSARRSSLSAARASDWLGAPPTESTHSAPRASTPPSTAKGGKNRFAQFREKICICGRRNERALSIERVAERRHETAESLFQFVFCMFVRRNGRRFFVSVS